MAILRCECGGKRDPTCPHCRVRWQAAPRPATTRPPGPSPRSLVPGGPVGRRHLLYHLLPAANWRKGVDQLRLRWSLFTGLKVVAVCTGPPVTVRGRTFPLDPPDVVRSYLPPGCEVVEVENRPDRWELASWPLLWGRVLAVAHPLDAVLYAHSKGVTRPDPGPCQDWADLLYALCLDYWPDVEAELRRGRPVVGPLWKDGAFFGPPSDGSDGHFSGNFFWARAGGFRWPAVPVPEDRWGAEAWAGIAHHRDEVGHVGPLRGHPGIDLYAPAFWTEQVVPALTEWQRDHGPTPPAVTTVPPAPVGGDVRLSVVVATKGRPSLGRALASITSQLLPGDELIVERDESGDWGATPRTRGMLRASGTHVLWMDDDDTYRPDAFARIREALRTNLGRPHLFQLRREQGFDDVLWRASEVEVGNVSTQMFVVPNDPSRFGVWGTRYEGDFDFIVSTLANYPDGPVWVPEVVAVWRPDPVPKMPPWWSYDPGSFDRHAWAETVARDDYRIRAWADHLAGGVGVDVGAHVGSATWLMRWAGMTAVHAYEPEPVSRSHLEANAARAGGIMVYPEAVGDVVAVWQQDGRPMGSPAVIGLDEAIDQAAAVAADGRVRLLKIDAEGAEWPALTRATRLDHVDRIVGEWHACEWDGRRWSGGDVAHVLRPHGFTVEIHLNPDLPGVGLFFAVRG